MTNAELWWNGPNWLENPDEWPPEIIAKPSTESKAKAKMTREVVAMATTTDQIDEFDELLNKQRLWRVLRTGAWVNWFVHNCIKPTEHKVHYAPKK